MGTSGSGYRTMDISESNRLHLYFYIIFFINIYDKDFYEAIDLEDFHFTVYKNRNTDDFRRDEMPGTPP